MGFNSGFKGLNNKKTWRGKKLSRIKMYYVIIIINIDGGHGPVTSVARVC